MIEAIERRMYRRRIPADKMQDWKWESTRQLRGTGLKPADLIQSFLDMGRRVTAGYTTTQIRNLHEYWVLWKPHGEGKKHNV